MCRHACVSVSVHMNDYVSQCVCKCVHTGVLLIQLNHGELSICFVRTGKYTEVTSDHDHGVSVEGRTTGGCAPLRSSPVFEVCRQKAGLF